jgi:hypothetical protein
MSDDEIRFWLTELRVRYGWGSNALGRTLGLRPNATNRKANGKEWLYAGERVKCARQIERILAGELVQVGGKNGDYTNPGRGVLAEHPVPLVPPVRFKYDLKLGRLRQVPRLERDA